MKVKHILDQTEKLRFVGLIDPCNGGVTRYEEDDMLQPDSWDHVRHITDNIYYVWNDGESKFGDIMLGYIA